MKMVTKIAVISALATFMFAGIGLTWGNMYSNGDAGMEADADFGVWFDINDATSVGWENGLKIGLAGPAGMTFRLGYDATTSLGVGRSWWSSTGNGWATSLNTTIDFTLTSSTDLGDDDAVGGDNGSGGTWTKPANITKIRLWVQGAGGGGSHSTNRAGEGGGAATRGAEGWTQLGCAGRGEGNLPHQ